MNEDRNQELETKRQELEQLRRRVAELEKELNGEAPSQFQIEFLMAEVSLTKLRELGFDWHTLVDGIEKQVEGKNEDVFRANESLPTQTFKAIVKAFRTKGLLKVLAQPTIVTTAGRPASVRSGGEFPIPMPGAGKQLSLQWRQFGVTAETVVTPLDNDQVRLDFSVECGGTRHVQNGAVQRPRHPGRDRERDQYSSNRQIGSDVHRVGICDEVR